MHMTKKSFIKSLFLFYLFQFNNILKLMLNIHKHMPAHKRESNFHSVSSYDKSYTHIFMNNKQTPFFIIYQT